MYVISKHRRYPNHTGSGRQTVTLRSNSRSVHSRLCLEMHPVVWASSYSKQCTNYALKCAQLSCLNRMTCRDTSLFANVSNTEGTTALMLIDGKSMRVVMPLILIDGKSVRDLTALMLIDGESMRDLTALMLIDDMFVRQRSESALTD